jgi:phosphate transport system permease protein
MKKMRDEDVGMRGAGIVKREKASRARLDRRASASSAPRVSSSSLISRPSFLLRWRGLAPEGNAPDVVFRAVLFLSALLIVALAAAMLWSLAANAGAAARAFGLPFLWGREWNPSRGRFGALPFVYGTLMSSLIALVISVPLSLGVAVFLVEQSPRRLSRPLTFLVELLAAIPSVVYGLWGIFVLAPALRDYVETPLQRRAGWLPVFQGPITGTGLLAGGVVLAIMITPIISAVARDVLAAVPQAQREAALALGATPWETTRVVLANGAPGIAGAIILGLGRAVGETMAVTMLIGNRAEISASLFAPSYTIASVLANELREANDDLHLSSLVLLALILFLLTLLINAAARLLVWGVTRGTGGAARA